jgi:hypothetical protein
VGGRLAGAAAGRGVENQPEDRLAGKRLDIEHEIVGERIVHIGAEGRPHVAPPRGVAQGIVRVRGRGRDAEPARRARRAKALGGDQPHVQPVRQAGGGEIGAAPEQDHAALARHVADELVRLVDEVPQIRMQAHELADRAIEAVDAILRQKAGELRREVMRAQRFLDQVAMIQRPGGRGLGLGDALHQRLGDGRAAGAGLARDRDERADRRRGARRARMRELDVQISLCLGDIDERAHRGRSLSGVEGGGARIARGARRYRAYPKSGGASARGRCSHASAQAGEHSVTFRPSS